MTRQPVQSSQITSIGHDPVKREMEIEFKSHAKPKPGVEPKPAIVYRFANVSQDDYAALVNAESIGKAFNAGIKADPKRYPFRKLEGKEAA